MASIQMEELSFPSDCQIDPYLANLLHRMVDKNPKTRITLEDVLNHEWVTKEGVLPAQAVGEDLGIPGQERVRSTALGKFVAGRRGRDNQLQLVIRHAVRHHTGEGGIAEDTAPSKGTKDAGTGAGNDSTSSNTLNRKSSSGPTIKRHTSSTKRPEQFSLAGGAGGVGHRGGEKTEPSPVLFPTSISPSRPCHFSSLSKQEQFPGGKDEQQQHKQNKQKQQQQQQQYATKGGERAGMVRCRSVEEEESVMTVARIHTKIDVEEDEIDEEEKTNVWSCGEDKVPSPRIMEAIVDKG